MNHLLKVSLALGILLAGGCNPLESTDPPEQSNVSRSCHTNDDCPDDGAFCTGTERCSPTCECISTGNPCLLGEQCDEEADRCDNCAIDENCDDGNACTVEVCTDGQCAYSPFVCQSGLDCVNGQCEDLCNTTDCGDGDPCTRDRCHRGVCVWEPVECSFGQHCLTQAGGCIPAPGDPCLTQCFWQGPSCPERPVDEFEDYDTLRNNWLADDEQCANYEGIYSWRLAGACADGTTFLADYFGLGYETHFFDANTGEFISLHSTTDIIDPFCCGRGYWPLNFNCENALVTEVICGTDIAEGDSFADFFVDFCGPEVSGYDPCLINFYLNPQPGTWSPPDSSDFEDFSTKRARWLEEIYFCASDYDLISRTAGSCADGSWFLYEDYYGDYVIDYFDSVSGDFLSRTYQSQVVDATCCGLSYYLVPRVCENPRVFEVFCGSSFEIGDTIPQLASTPCGETIAESDPCRQFNLVDLDGHPIDPSTIEFSNYDNRRMFWIDDTEYCENDETGTLNLAAGVCADGTKFLLQKYWTGASVEYYNAETGEFLSTSFQSEFADPQCCGLTYYPQLRFCHDALVTEVFCGNELEVGNILRSLDGYYCFCDEEPHASYCTDLFPDDSP